MALQGYSILDEKLSKITERIEVMKKLDVFEGHDEEYVFSALRFLPNKWQIEVFKSGNIIPLTKIQRGFLLTLIKTPNRLVSYDDLRRSVWSHEPEVDQRLIHNMHVAKSKLANLLEDHGIDSSFINTVDGEGYKLVAEIDTALNNQNFHNPEKPPNTERRQGTGLRESLNPETSVVTVNRSVIRSHLFPGASTEIKKTSLKRNLSFGLIFTALLSVFIWYYGIFPKSGTDESGSAENQNFRDNRIGKQMSVPKIERVEIISDPSPKTEFYVYIAGSDFNPEIARLKVTGPGCGGDNPCVVPNGALRLYGSITGTTIEKAPLTLGKGEYRIWLENENGNISNQMTIVVPASISK